VITVVSFGYLHGAPPEAHLTADLRAHFRDPHVRAEFRELTAEDPAVMSALARAAEAFTAGLPDVTVAIGCAGGRHRSAALAILLARSLADRGHEVRLEHRDIGKPVAHRSGAVA
jgi:UPF0042 nucleotide-binding protein